MRYLQKPAQVVCGRAVRSLSDDIGYQPPIAGRLLASQHHSLPHGRVLAERRFDLFQFDAEATDLHLVVNTTEVVDVSIQPIAGDVAALIQSCPRITAERVWDELLGGQIGTIEIASPQAGARDVQLARNSHRKRPGVTI